MKKDGPQLPQVFENPALPKTKRLGAAAAKLTLQAAYRGFQPTEDAPFAKTPDLPRLKRFYVQTDDGWQLPVYRLPVHPHGSGEPVILAPSMGLNHHSLQFSRQSSIAWKLQEAGFAVFFFTQRGDHGAIPPSSPHSWDFDDITRQDVPATIEGVLERTEFQRIHWVGHGLGGQLLVGYLANEGDAFLASASLLCAPVRFQSPASRARALQFAMRLLPSQLELPTRGLSRLTSPAFGEDSPWMEHLGNLKGDSSVARGLLLHGTENLGAGLLKQVSLWTERGFLSDRSGQQDLASCLEGLSLPVFLLASEGDRSCPPEAAFALDLFLDGPVDRLRPDASWGHTDPLLAEDAAHQVFPRILSWVQKHRRKSWAKITEVEEQPAVEKQTASR